MLPFTGQAPIFWAFCIAMSGLAILNLTFLLEQTCQAYYLTSIPMDF